MKNESQLPRLIALALLAVIVLLLARTRAFAEPTPASGSRLAGPSLRG